MRKVIRYDGAKCRQDAGCRLCIIACPNNCLEFIGTTFNYCVHCPPENAPCIQACTRNALKPEDGIIKPTKSCNLCGECAKACNFGGIQVKNSKLLKCDLCSDYGEALCAIACPFGALEVATSSEPPKQKDGTIVETKIDLHFLGDERKYSHTDWLCQKEITRPKLFFRILNLPTKPKHLLAKLNHSKVYKLHGEDEPVLIFDFPHFTESDLKIGDEVKGLAIEKVKFELDGLNRENRILKAASCASKYLSEFGIQKTKLNPLSQLLAYDIGGYSLVELFLSERSHIENIEQIRLGEPIHAIVKGIGNCRTNLLIPDRQSFRSIVNRLAEATNKTISEACPKLDFFLEHSDRVVALYPPYSTFGGSFSIRLSPTHDPWTLPKLISVGTISPKLGAYLWMLEETKISGLITGPPSTGKTALLNSLIQCTPPNLVIRTIEEGTRELVAGHSWSSFVGKTQDERELSEKRNIEASLLTGEDLLSTVLRFYVDRLYIGEIRGPEARYFTTALNLGIPSVKTTLHTHETGASILSRLTSPPMNVPTENLPYIRFFISLKKNLDGKRIVSNLGELRWNVWGDLAGRPDWKDASGNYSVKIKNVFSHDPFKGKFRHDLKNSIMFKEYSKEKGIALEKCARELQGREEILAGLVKQKIMDKESVQKTFHDYYKNGN